jgi:hypothetical protein
MDAKTTLLSTGLDSFGSIGKSRFMQRAFAEYFRREKSSGHYPVLHVEFRKSLTFDQAKKLEKGSYVVTSSSFYRRYVNRPPPTSSGMALTSFRGEKRAIGYVRSRNKVAVFFGRGPVIEIYRIE